MEMFDLISMSLATAAASTTITRTRIFEGLRERVRPWLSLDCSYCVSHWVAAVFAAFHAHHVEDFVLWWLASVGGAAIVAKLILGDE